MPRLFIAVWPPEEVADELMALPRKDDAGHVVSLYGTIQDISERKRAELESERLASIVASSDDAIIGKSLSSIITSWNRGAQKIFGYTAEEMVGTSITRLIPPDRHTEEDVIIASVSRGESVEQVIARLRGKLARLPGANLFLVPVQDIRIGGRQANASWQYTLQADDLADLRTWEPRIRVALSQVPKLADVLEVLKDCQTFSYNLYRIFAPLTRDDAAVAKPESAS